MVQMRQVAYEDFILIEADQTTAESVELVHKLGVAAVIVRRRKAQGVYYYLFIAEEFLARLAKSDETRSLEVTLNLHEYTSTPVVTADANAEMAPDSVIITENDAVVGFYNVEVDPRSARRGSSEEGLAPGTPVARALQTDFPVEVVLGQTASLLISLVKLVQAATGRTAQPMAMPFGGQVEIMVQAQNGFEVDGNNEGKLIVTDVDETLPLKFQLRATEVGPGRIRVLSFQNGQPLGAISLTPTVIPADQVPAGQRTRSRQGVEPNAGAQPDLTLRIFERSDGGKRTITMELKAKDPELGLEYSPFGPVELRLDPLQYFQEFFKDVESLTIRTPDERKIAELKLELEGARLYEELIPRNLRTLLWTIRDRIDTLQVYSDEPWIPWELLRLVGEENGNTVEGPFLCEAFAMTRWFPGVARQLALRLKRIGVVIPTNSGLVFAQQERDYLHTIGTDQWLVEDIPARYLDLVSALSAGTYNCLHFSGHALSGKGNPDDAQITLENDCLKAGQIAGRVRNLGRARPLVFLNACQTGQAALSLTGIGGWAKSLVDAGASGFVGSLWSVRDQAACEFAKTLYGHLLAGEPIGQAVRDARKAIRPLNDTTWLAYTVFADPAAKIAS